jgi:hypothetical protein
MKRDTVIEKLSTFPEAMIEYSYSELNECDCCECQKDGIVGKWLTRTKQNVVIKSIKEYDSIAKKKDFKLLNVSGHETTYVQTTLAENGTRIGTYTGNGESQTIIMLDDNGDILPPSSMKITRSNT